MADLRVHPDRDAINAELHARPVDIIEATTRVRRVVFILPPGQDAMSRLIDRFRQYCADHSLPVPPPDVRQFSFRAGSLAVTWEMHTEFVTITWRAPLGDGASWPEDIGLAVLEEAELISASRIDVIGDHAIPDRFLGQFNPSSLCVSTIEDGAGAVITDFVADAEGFTRFELAAGGLSALRRSVVTRRLLEVDTYRSMALLALPLARRTAPDLAAAERDLARVIETLPGATTTDEVQVALAALHELSVRSGQLSERLGYRFAAARAYGDILKARLQGLHEGPTAVGSSLGRYLNNRVEPALGTCIAMEKRLNALIGKIERGIEILNVRIGLDLEIQNRTVLETIASTARSQFRLQRTVEGLSVIAISYYVLGVLGYLFAGPLEYLALDKALALSVAAPFALLGVWLFIRAIQRSHFGHG